MAKSTSKPKATSAKAVKLTDTHKRKLTQKKASAFMGDIHALLEKHGLASSFHIQNLQLAAKSKGQNPNCQCTLPETPHYKVDDFGNLVCIGCW